MITNNIYFDNVKCNANSFKASPTKSLIQPICDTVEITSKPVKNAIGVTGIAGIITSLLAKPAQSDNITFEDCMQARDKQDFVLYKSTLLKWLQQNGYNKYNENHYADLMQEIQDSNSIEEINDNLEFLISRVMNSYSNLMCDDVLNLQNKIAKQEFSPELDDYLNTKERETGDKLIPLLKLISQKDSDKEIIKIKEDLQKKYGIREFYCNNNLEFVKSCEKVFSILTQNKIKIPPNIIANDAVDGAGLAINTSKGAAVIINLEDMNYLSPEIGIPHIIAHEILHTTQPNTLEFKTKSIPENMQKIADNVSDYANGNFALEVHCELYVKKIFSGLSDDEEKLFNFLGGSSI